MVSTGTVSVGGYSLTHHVQVPAGTPRGVVVYLDGDGQPLVSSQTKNLQAMADAATAAGFAFMAPRSPMSDNRWWHETSAAPYSLARDYVDYAASRFKTTTVHLVGYSGGTVCICRELVKVGSWPSRFTGGALNIGGGSRTNPFSTPTDWRTGWPVRFVVGTKDVEGAAGNVGWSAKATAEGATADFKAAGHPSSIQYTNDDHYTYNFGGHLAAYLKADGGAPAPAPTKSAAEVLAEDLSNVDAIIAAAQATGVPLHIAAALIYGESRGLNIYGHDSGGIFSTANGPVTIGSTTYPAGSDIPVTRTNYELFLSRLRAGEKSNGVGPAQWTFGPSILQFEAQGVDLSDPVQNITAGLRLLAQHLGGDYTRSSVEAAGTLYNKGNLTGGVNDYGRRLWTHSERYRLALAGTSTDPVTPGPDPTPTKPVETSPDPAAAPIRYEDDPGAIPSLAAFTDADLPVWPDYITGPARPAETIVQSTVRAFWRGTWWPVVDGDASFVMAMKGPDQSPVGATMLSAESTITLRRPELLTRQGWNPYRDDPPAKGEPITIMGTVDGGRIWNPILEDGIVAGSESATNQTTIQLRVTTSLRGLAKNRSHPPLNFRMPSTEEGMDVMRMGLHPAYFVNWVARESGWYSTPPMDEGCVLSAPGFGSMWPERGELYSSFTLDKNSDSPVVASDSPVYRRTRWGLAVTNVWASYRPVLKGNQGRLPHESLGFRMFVGPTTGYPGYVEFWWDWHSICVQVRNGAIRTEVQTGWADNGNRVVAYSRESPITPEQERNGFELVWWMAPDGSIAVRVDGVQRRHTPIPSLSTEMLKGPVRNIRFTTRPQSCVFGGIQVISQPGDTLDVAPFATTFHAEIDPAQMIWGSPALVDKPGRELLEEAAEALLAAVWVDRTGGLHWVDRSIMDARQPVRLITRADLVRLPWQVSADSLVSAVDVAWRQPSLFQDRKAARDSAFQWEGPRETLRAGQEWEEIVSVPEDEDWFSPDLSFSDVTESTVASASKGVGSWVGATLLGEDSSNNSWAPPGSWFYGVGKRIDWRTYQIKVKYTPPKGTGVDIETTTAELSGLRKSLQGRGPIMRGRGRATWSDVHLDAPRRTKAYRADPQAEEQVFEHAAAWFVQSQATAKRIAWRLAEVLGVPMPVYGDAVLAVPDLTLQLGDTVTLDQDGHQVACRVCGIRYQFGADGLHQSLTLRQIKPEEA